MTLDLVLTYKWYDMIASGEKLEEYREVGTWAHRLLKSDIKWLASIGVKQYLSWFNDDIRAAKRALDQGMLSFRPYDTVRFHRGYTSTTMEFKIKDITIGMGKPEWGAPLHDVFIISLSSHHLQ